MSRLNKTKLDKTKLQGINRKGAKYAKGGVISRRKHGIIKSNGIFGSDISHDFVIPERFNRESRGFQDHWVPDGVIRG